MQEVKAAVEEFLATWAETPAKNKQGFVRLMERLAATEGLRLEFHPRPGLTYSLRALCPGYARPLLLMIDVIEDQPRWLSVCFFADLVNDPEERGAHVPGGLLGEDALCFDLEACTAEALGYVEARIDEAWQSVTGS